MVKEDNFYSVYLAFMDSNRIRNVQLNSDIIFVFYASWVTCQIACLSLSVSFVVGADHPHVLSEQGQSISELIHHNSKAAYCRPPAEFRCTENNGSEFVLFNDRLSSSERSKLRF